MRTWVYAAWFRSLVAELDDQDYEWVAVLAISALNLRKGPSRGETTSQRSERQETTKTDFFGQRFICHQTRRTKEKVL